jgi:hypothetical protein
MWPGLLRLRYRNFFGSVVGDVDVRPAVVVHVHQEDAQPLAEVPLALRLPQAVLGVLIQVRQAGVLGRRARQAQPGFVADVGERAVAVVAVQGVGAGVELPGGADVAGDVRGVTLAGGVVGERPVHVLADVQVGVAVAVQVTPGGAGAPEVVALQPDGLGDLDEAPAALAVGLVVEEGQPAVAGDEQVGPAVAVVVGDGNPVAVEVDAVEAGLRGHVAELPAAQVAVQLAGVALNLLLVRAVEIAAAGEEDVEQAVAVVVDQRHPAAQRLQDGVVVGLLAVAVGEVHARAGRHVAEQVRVRGRARRVGSVVVRGEERPAHPQVRTGGRQRGRRNAGQHPHGPVHASALSRTPAAVGRRRVPVG